MKEPRRSAHDDLTRRNYVLTSDGGYGRVITGVVVVLIALLLLVAGLRFFENHLAPQSYLSDVRAENLELRKEVAKARFELEVEVATRSELERQVASLNEQLKQVRDELAFLKSASARPPAGK